jgi:hypothetical protein
VARCSEFSSQKLEKPVSDESRDQSDFKIGGGKNVCQRPNDTLLPRHTGAFELAHEKVGVKEEDDKRDLYHTSPGIFHHGTSWLLRENTRDQ